MSVPNVRTSVFVSPNISDLRPNISTLMSGIYKNDTRISARFLAAVATPPHCTAWQWIWRVGLGIPLGSGLPPLRTAGPAVLPGAAPERVRVCALLQARRVRRTPSAVHCTPCTVHCTRHPLRRTRYTAYPALYTSETLHPPLYHCTPCSLEAPKRTVATRNKPLGGLGVGKLRRRQRSGSAA